MKETMMICCEKDCGKECVRASNRQLRCKECSRKVETQRKGDQQRLALQTEQGRASHRESNRRYREANREICRERIRAWRQTDSGRESLRAAKCRYMQTAIGREKHYAGVYRYRITEKGRNVHRGANVRYRKRQELLQMQLDNIAISQLLETGTQDEK